jgi:hypothetical protein
VAPVITTISMQPATPTCLSPFMAPQYVHGPGSESAFSTLGINPVVRGGIDAVARVRDAKQAAPPRGEAH